MPDPRDSDDPPARALRRHSQNFLVDTRIAHRIVDALAPRPDDLVIEVGPGRGALTTILAQRVAELRAIEIDPRLIADLTARFPGIRLSQRDVLAAPLVDAGSEVGRRARVISNLPYGISSPFLLKLVEERATVADAVILLQREVVDRLVAAPGTHEYGSLSVVLQLAFDLTPLFEVPASAFRPRPEVRSRLLRLDSPSTPRLLDGDEQSLRVVLRAGFGQRRKMLAKTLAAALEIDRGEIETRLGDLDHPPTVRPERLSPATWLTLARDLADRLQPSDRDRAADIL